MITPAHWDKGISYLAYRTMINASISEGKITEYLDYTKMNVQRMNRLDKTATILPALAEKVATLPAQKWLILTEGWCGDAAQNLPILAKLADLASQIELRLLLRDAHLDLMDLYLTEGGRSIPKLIVFEEPATDIQDWKEFFNWGPRPAPAQDLVLSLKKAETPFEVLSEKLHKWYADDKGIHLQQELLALFL
jgi:hypothetical protein